MSMHRHLAQMMRAPPDEGIITAGLTHRWPLTEGAGTDIHDVVGGLDGTIVNPGGNWTADGLTLNGTNQYVSLPSQVVFTSTGPWSLCGWWKSNSSSNGYQSQVALLSTLGYGVMGMYAPTNASYNDAWIDAASGAGVRINRLASSPLDRWVFMAYVLEGLPGDTGNTHIYVDSVSTPVVGGGVTGAAATVNSIGSKGPANYFSGSIEDVRVYNRLLSQGEIDSIFAKTG